MSSVGSGGSSRGLGKVLPSFRKKKPTGDPGLASAGPGGGAGGGSAGAGAGGGITSGNEDVLSQIRADDPNLIKLSLYGRGLGDAGAARLADALRSNSHLKVIDVGRNGITAAGCSSLASVLAEGDQGRQPSGLETLWIRENSIGTEGVAALSKALEGNRTLAGISLGRNGIDESGARHLASMLRKNDHLRSVWLYGNNLGDTGTSSLAEALLVNRTVREIYLGGNGVTDAGAKNLGSVLVHNPSLVKLELYKNGIADAGAVNLADGLRSNGTLAELNVRGNRIGVDGCSALIDVLNENGTLRLLDVRENAVPAAQLGQLDRHVAGLNRFCNVLIRKDQHPAPPPQAGGGAGAHPPQRPGMTSKEMSYMDRNVSARGGGFGASAAATFVDGASAGGGGAAVGTLEPIPDEEAQLPPIDLKSLDSVCAHLSGDDPRLTDVDLSDVGIADAGLVRLVDCVKHSTHLRSLGVRNCNVTNEGVEALAAAMVEAPEDGDDDGGGGGGAEGGEDVPPPKTAAGFRRLEELNLGWNDVLDRGVVKLSHNLRGNSALRLLLLNNAALGDEGAAALAELLRAGDAALEELHVRHNSVGCDGVALLGAALLDNSTLRRLLLGWNDVGQAGAEYVADALRTNRTVELLDLDGNNIGPEGGASVAYGLRGNDALTALWLSSNDLGDAGAAGAATALSQETSALRQLDLEFNDITAEGVRPVAEALRDRPTGTLTTLWLGGNRIGDEGVELLAEALRVNQSLTELGIKFNDVSHEGAQALADGLRDGPSRLEVLWMGGNPRVGDDGASAFADLLCRNPPLAVLTLDGCGITDEGASVIYSALEENGTLTALDLGGNAVGDMGVLSLLEHATKSNRAGAAGRGDDGEEEEGDGEEGGMYKAMEELLYMKKKNEHKEELRLV